jgi:hypothetical protein
VGGILPKRELRMIRHEITISKFFKPVNHVLFTLNRDLKKHREGGFPAERSWYKNGTLEMEIYYLNGKLHREGDLPAYRRWCWNGTLGYEEYYLNGKEHREEDLPAYREWDDKGRLEREAYWLNGVEYDPT